MACGGLQGGEAEGVAAVAADDPLDAGVAEVADAVEEDDDGLAGHVVDGIDVRGACVRREIHSRMQTITVRTLVLGSVVLGAMLGGCAAGTRGNSHAANLPAADAQLAPLAFLAGGWIDATDKPNMPFNEEHWMLPRGKSMAGAFRRIGGDGIGRFVEVTHINVAEDGVYLRLRHFHNPLEPRAGETDANVFKLREANGKRAIFDGVENTRGVSSVTYAAEGADKLNVEIVFSDGKPTEKFSMHRIRGRGD